MLSLRWLNKQLNHNRTKQVYLTCLIVLPPYKINSSKPLPKMPSTSCSSSSPSRYLSNSNNRAIYSVVWTWINHSSSNNLWCNKCHSKPKFNQISRHSSSLRIASISWVVNNNSSSSSNLFRTNSTSCNSHSSLKWLNSSNNLFSSRYQCSNPRITILGHSSRQVQHLNSSRWIYLED